MLHKIPCFIIDDEEPAVELLTYFIAKEPDLELLGFSHNAINLPSNILNSDTLLFLDIQMPYVSGIDFLKENQKNLNVIFSTSQNNHAIQAYDLAAIDYLLKPFSQARFSEAVTKARNVFKLKNLELTEQNKTFIEVKYDYKTLKIMEDTILYIEGLKQYLKIHTEQKTYIILDSFKNMEKQLSSNFIRVHKSYMINKLHVTSYSKTAAFIHKIEIPLSKGFDTGTLSIK
jgi:DNA-binding LytR/AlgR family response regulator